MNEPGRTRPDPPLETADASASESRYAGLLAANRSIVSELSLSGVLRRIAEVARDVSAARYAAVGVVGPDGSLAEFVHVGIDEQTVKNIGRRPEGLGVLTVTDPPSPVRLDSVVDDGRFRGFPGGHPDMRSFLAVPIQVRGAVFGNLYLANRVGGDFSAEDEELVTALAATAGIAVENARLYEESRRRQEWLKASVEIGRELMRPGSAATDMLVRIADTVLALGAADMVLVVFPSGDDTVEVRVARGEGAEQVIGTQQLARGSLAGAVMTQSHAQMIPYGKGQQRVVELDHVLPVGPVLACPLVGEAGVRGAILVGRSAGSRAFDQSDLEMAESVAGYAAVALELADARRNQEHLAVLQDRHRIARDLHDHVIQRLFATGLQLQSLVSEHADGPRESGDGPSQRLNRSVEDIDETIRQIRTSIFELTDEGTAMTPRRALLGVVDSVEPALGHRPGVELAGAINLQLEPDLLADVVAVVREGLTNVARHAEADRSTVRIDVDEDRIVVEVCDNGTAPVVERSGHGLPNLRARADQRHGTLQVSHDDEGTVLRWTALL